MNSVQVMGNLARDPQIRATKTGRAVASFSIAVNRNYTTPQGEQRELIGSMLLPGAIWQKRWVTSSKREPVFLSKGVIPPDLMTLLMDRDGMLPKW